MTKSKTFFLNLIKPIANFYKKDGVDANEVDLERIAAREHKQFSIETLLKATKNFHFSHKLGEGGFGPVFKGTLDDGREIAVKKLSQRSTQGKKEFQNEANLLSSVQHKNVVSLFGYCIKGEEKLLVYEYVANQSLDKLLFRPRGRGSLDWGQRHKIITGVAKGLLYLHEDAHDCIIHRDIKASNILLDDTWEPKIADFGLAHLYPKDQTHISTHVAGTNGYMAPEYFMQGKLSTKADVFSFGVVVLELISGLRNSSFNRDLDSHNLLEWVYKQYKKNQSLAIIDPTLMPSTNMEQIETFIQIGLLCTQLDQQLRPDMRRVVRLVSRKTTILEEPTRPGYFDITSRKTSKLVSTSSTTGTTDNSNFQLFSSTASSKNAALALKAPEAGRQQKYSHQKYVERPVQK